jgi:hypothetical protein
MKVVETLAVGVAATMTVDDTLAMMDEVGVADGAWHITRN